MRPVFEEGFVHDNNNDKCQEKELTLLELRDDVVVELDAVVRLRRTVVPVHVPEVRVQLLQVLLTQLRRQDRAVELLCE